MLVSVLVASRILSHATLCLSTLCLSCLKACVFLKPFRARPVDLGEEVHEPSTLDSELQEVSRDEGVEFARPAE